MLPENSLVPFKVSDIPQGSSLIFAPHPDDETFGLGGTILKMVAQGASVAVVLMTDGSRAGDSQLRLGEFQQVTKSLGVAKCFYLNIPDREVQVDAVVIAKVAELIDGIKPENVFFPSPFEYHIDHRTTAWIVWSVLKKIKFSGNAFSYEIGNQSPINTLVDVSDVMPAKYDLMLAYQSQLGFNNYPEKIQAMNRARAYTLPSHVEFAEGFFCFESIEGDLLTPYYRNLSKFREGYRLPQMPLVSVLIRTKNRRERLQKALDSIALQTYPYIEVNCVNDGGENVKELLDNSSFTRVNLIDNVSSKGRAAAANQLLDMATGEYCIFLDDDDEFDADHLEHLVNEVNNNPSVKAVYSGVRAGVGENSQTYGQPFNAGLLRRGNYIPIHSVLFSRDLLDQGCRFDESLEIYEDWDFWLQVSQVAAMVFIDRTSATYHIHGDSGAGQSGIRIDERYWKLQIYAKWLKIWSSTQLEQSFQAINQANAKQIQSATQKELTAFRSKEATELENQKLRQELAALKKQVLDGSNSDNEIKLEQVKQENIELQNKIETLKVASKSQQNWSANLLNSFVMSHDVGAKKARPFKLKSARNYVSDCMALFDEVFGYSISPKFWNWKYNGTHWRNVCAVDDNGKVVGFYGGTQRKILAFGKQKLGIEPCDIMVSPKNRGGLKNKSVFYALLNTWTSMNLNESSDYYICFGFPNERHYRLGQALGKYSKGDGITEVIWDTNAITLSKQVKYSLVTELNMNEVNLLWTSVAEDFKNVLIGVRDAQFFIWRYLNHPEHQYQIYSVNSEVGDLIGIFVLKIDKKEFKLMDLLANKVHFPLIIYAACDACNNEGGSRLKSWISASQAFLLDYEGAKFSKTDVFVTTMHGRYALDSKKIKDHWFVTYGDTDFI